MQNTRPILTHAGFRPVIMAWLLALAVAALLAFIVGGMELRRLQRVQALIDSEQQFSDLTGILIHHFDGPRDVFEREVLNGHALEGKPTTYPVVADAAVDTGEGSLFEFHGTRGAGRPTTTPLVQTVLRTNVDAVHIHPRFTGWTLRLKFVDDRLQAASAFNPGRALLRRPIAGVRTAHQAAEAVIVIAAAIALVCMVAANPVGARWRRQVAAIGVAGAVLALVAANLHPARYSRPILNETSTFIVWAMTLLTLTASAMLPPRRRRQSDRPLCPCGYDLTGNVSGICPECGRPTAQGRLDRWVDNAAAIAGVSETATGPFTGTYLSKPLLIEAKCTSREGVILRHVSALARQKLTCYRYGMTDARTPPDDEQQRNDQDTPGSDKVAADGSYADAALPDDAAQQFICPHCSAGFSVQWVPSDGVVACPNCGAETVVNAQSSEADRELEERLEVERRSREAELDGIRIRQVLTERRALFRMRSYFIALGATAAVAAGQLGIWCYGRLMRTGFDLFVIGYITAIAGLTIAAIFCVGKIRLYNRELARPTQSDPAGEPDFSTLSDGSQRLDTAARNLARLYDREQ